MSATGAPGGPVDPTELRISDADRNSALSALGEHLSVGRVDLAEYESRSAQITGARTVRDLTGLFTDLPGPHPQISSQLVPVAPRAAMASQPAPTPGSISKGQRILAAVTAASSLLAVIAFFLLNGVWDKAWMVFLLIPLVSVISKVTLDNDRR